MKKKLIISIMLVIICMFIVGCGDNSSNGATTSSDTSTTATDNNASTSNQDESEDTINSNDTTQTTTENDEDTNNTTANTSGKLRSEDGMLELENNYCSDGSICGTIKNLSSEPYSYVEVNINLFDANGNQVDSTLANVNNLGGNTNWNFKAVVLDQSKVAKYKVVSIQGNR